MADENETTPVEETPAAEPAPEEPAPEAAAEPEAAEEKKEEKPAAAPCSGSCPCDMITEPFKKSEFFGKAKEIFMWNDLMVSLGVFCVVNVFFILLICYDFTVVGLICWISLFALLAALCFDIMHVIAYFKGENTPSQLADKNFAVPADYIKGFFELVAGVVEAFLGVCINAILIRSVPFSLGMIFGFLFIIYLAAKMGICGMLYAAILFCFIWFRLYNDHQAKIDELFQKLKDFVNQQIQQLKEKLNKPKAQ